MPISNQLVQELKQILKEEYEQEFEIKDVSAIATDLVDYYDTLAQIFHKIKQEEKETCGALKDDSKK